MHLRLLLLFVSFCRVTLSAEAGDDDGQDPTGLVSDLIHVTTVESQLAQASAAIGVDFPPRIRLVIRAHADLLRHWLERERVGDVCVAARDVRTIRRSTEALVSELHHLIRVMDDLAGPERLEDVRMPNNQTDSWALRRRHLEAVIREVAGGLDDDGSERLHQQIEGLADIRELGQEDEKSPWNLVPADHPARQELRAFQEKYRERLASEEVDFVEREVMGELLDLRRDLVSQVQSRAEFALQSAKGISPEAMLVHDLAQSRLTSAIRERIAHQESWATGGSAWGDRDLELKLAVSDCDSIARGVDERLQEFEFIDHRYSLLVDQCKETHPLVRAFAEERCASLGKQRDQVFAAVLAQLRGSTPSDVLKAEAMLELLSLDIATTAREIDELHSDAPGKEKIQAHLADPVIAHHLARFEAAQVRRETARRRKLDIQRDIIQAQLRVDEAMEELQRLEVDFHRSVDAIDGATENIRAIVGQVEEQIRDPQPVPDANKDF
jgi:hypothetical protein